MLFRKQTLQRCSRSPWGIGSSATTQPFCTPCSSRGLPGLRGTVSRASTYERGSVLYCRHNISCRSPSVAPHASDTAASWLLRTERTTITQLCESDVEEEAGTRTGWAGCASVLEGRAEWTIGMMTSVVWGWLHTWPLCSATRKPSKRPTASFSFGLG